MRPRLVKSTPGYDSGDFIMKNSKRMLHNINDIDTRQTRRRTAGSKSVKITINIDRNCLAILRAKSAATGVPYQRLLNQFLMKALESDGESESRLDRLEKKINKLKRKLSS
jgi:predicted DNA binding CopG/RHH family protein